MISRDTTVWIEEPGTDHIAHLASVIRRVYPQAKTKTVCSPERDAYRIEVYTQADSADAVLELIEEDVARILLEENISITVIPLPVSHYKDNGASPDRD